MRRLGVFSLVGVMVILLAWVGTPNMAGASPGLTVIPLEYHFGEVELFSSVSTGVIVTNTWFDTLAIVDIYMATSSSPDFTYALPPFFNGEIPPMQSIEIQVTYSPSTLGDAAAVLVIDWSNGEAGINQVMFDGTGIEAGQPVTIQDILDFFDQSVADGSLVGSGPGKSADGRLKALRNMIEAADDLIIVAGDYDAACEQLWAAYDRCDGESPPPDFVTGDAAENLATKISDLMASLGCE